MVLPSGHERPVARAARRRGRPPGAGARTRERLIRVGMEVLTEQGFGSTGLEEVLRRGGVPKGSFYYYFTSKEAFGAAVIDGYARYFADKLDRHLTGAAQPRLARLQAFIDDAGRGMRRHAFRRGCLVGNLGQELGSTHDAFRTQLAAVFDDWNRRVARLLDEARAAGEFAADEDSAALAELFWIGWEGAVLRARLVRSAEPLDRFAHVFFTRVLRRRA
jgi:TetR/AcrR family transcriptional repressor of nem operon